jgi:hypothetical protein
MGDKSGWSAQIECILEIGGTHRLRAIRGSHSAQIERISKLKYAHTTGNEREPVSAEQVDHSFRVRTNYGQQVGARQQIEWITASEYAHAVGSKKERFSIYRVDN